MKRFNTLLIVLVLSSLLLGCSAVIPEPVTSEKLTPIKIQLVPFFSYAPFYIADKEGYFAEEGLQPEFVRLFDAEVYVGLLKGDLDVGATILRVVMLNSIMQTGDIKIVADKGHIAATGCSAYAILARTALVESGELEDINNMKGRVVSYESTTLQGYYLDKLLKPANLSLDDIEGIEFNNPSLDIEAFQSKKIDLSMQSEPWITILQDTHSAVLWKDFNELLPGFQYSVILFGPSILEKNNDLGQRFMRAYLKAVRQYNLGKTERNLELIAAFTEQERTLLEQMCWPAIREDGMVNTQSIISYNEWAKSQGYIDAVMSPEQFWDESFIKSVP